MYSGKDATFKSGGVALSVDVVGWNHEESAADHRIATDKTAGHKVSVLGTGDSNIRLRVKVPSSGSLPFDLRDELAAQFHVDNTGNNYIAQNVIVASKPIPVDVDDGEPSEVEYVLGPRGAPVYHGSLCAAGSSGY
jgi:hypothetical protein